MPFASRRHTSAGGGIPPVIGSLASGNEAIMTFIIVLLKGMQWLSKNRSPGPWDFDIPDHHNANGGSTVRLLQVFLTQVVSAGKSSITSIAISRGPGMFEWLPMPSSYPRIVQLCWATRNSAGTGVLQPSLQDSQRRHLCKP